MMKNIIRSPYRKMKILFILPVFAIVLYSFAKPDYKYKYPDQNSGDKMSSVALVQHEVRGTILEQNGKPLPGAIVTLKGTTIGTSADVSGSFRIGNVPDDGVMVVSFVGFKSKVVKPDFKAPMIIAMVKDTVKYNDINISTPPPPPPPPPAVTSLFNGDGPKPLFIVEGKITTAPDVEKIDPNSIESITVLKDNSASDKYGTKGKDGVVEITLKKKIKGSPTQLPEVAPPPPPPPVQSDKIRQDGQSPLPFVVVQKYPEFTGGNEAMITWITANLKYPGEAYKEKITGKVLVDFTVRKSGKVNNVTVSKSVHPLLDAEAIRLIGSMPDWKPATQSGKAVDIQVCVPVEFKLQ
jgi:TonB family protein